MIRRTIEVMTDGSLVAIRDRQLTIMRNDEQVASIPAEDIGILILAGRVSVTHAALDALMQAGACVVTCSAAMQPSGMLLPVQGNVLAPQRLRMQLDAKLPLKKQLWTRVVVAKILQQAAIVERECYGWAGQAVAVAKLKALGSKVRSGDPENIEAQAARVHWEALREAHFGAAFRRDPDGAPPNNLLNYGYAVLRACMARALVGAGFAAAVGIHHGNRENAFALADDMLEPYRAFVDAQVIECVRTWQTELNRPTKALLLAFLETLVTVAGDKGVLQLGVQKTAQSLVTAFETRDAEALALPDA